jgi:hypothetical protein
MHDDLENFVQKLKQPELHNKIKGESRSKVWGRSIGNGQTATGVRLLLGILHRRPFGHQNIFDIDQRLPGEIHR